MDVVGFFNPPSKAPKGGTAGFIEVYFLGIALVILGHYVFWSLGFQLGFWEFFTSTMIVSTAFFMLCACLSEMTGILPFSGGAYGFARVTTGPYWGFVVGFFDSVSNILYVTLYVRTFVDFIITSFSLTSPNHLYPLWWFLVYLGMYVLHLLLNKYSFQFMSVMGFICLMVPLIYIFGTAHLQDFKANVTDQEKFVHHESFKGGAPAFMGIVPFSSILYFGVDMICLACEDTKNATVVVPRVIMAVMTTLFCLAVVMMFCVASQPPGILGVGFIPLPLSTGFSALFSTTFEYATISVLPAYFIILYSIMYVYGRQMCALARSSLLPKVFSYTTSVGNVPYTAIALGNFLGMIVVLWQWFGTSSKAEFDATGKNLFYSAQMCSVSVYLVTLLSFIVFRYKYSTLKRHFVNYLGIPSALLGIALFTFIWIALGFYQFNYFPIKCFTCLFGLATVYYFCYARHHQSFSPEEESILLTVYVIKANSRHRTVAKWIEKRAVRLLNRLDPTGKLLSLKKGTSGSGPGWRKKSSGIGHKDGNGDGSAVEEGAHGMGSAGGLGGSSGEGGSIVSPGALDSRQSLTGTVYVYDQTVNGQMTEGTGVTKSAEDAVLLNGIADSGTVMGTGNDYIINTDLQNPDAELDAMVELKCRKKQIRLPPIGGTSSVVVGPLEAI